jgi:cell division protein FtsB
VALVRRLILPVVVTGLLVGVLSLAVLPTRTWFDQRGAIRATEAEIAEIDAQIESLEGRLDALDSDEEIERIARERFDLVMPGEEAYGILPPAEPTWPIPSGWPFTTGE